MNFTIVMQRPIKTIHISQTFLIVIDDCTQFLENINQNFIEYALMKCHQIQQISNKIMILL